MFWKSKKKTSFIGGIGLWNDKGVVSPNREMLREFFEHCPTLWRDYPLVVVEVLEHWVETEEITVWEGRVRDGVQKGMFLVILSSIFLGLELPRFMMPLLIAIMLLMHGGVYLFIKGRKNISRLKRLGDAEEAYRETGRLGYCLSCGYNLRGGVSDACNECGEVSKVVDVVSDQKLDVGFGSTSKAMWYRPSFPQFSKAWGSAVKMYARRKVERVMLEKMGLEKMLAWFQKYGQIIVFLFFVLFIISLIFELAWISASAFVGIVVVFVPAILLFVYLGMKRVQKARGQIVGRYFELLEASFVKCGQPHVCWDCEAALDYPLAESEGRCKTCGVEILLESVSWEK